MGKVLESAKTSEKIKTTLNQDAPVAIAKGNAIVKEHFEFLNIITKISFSDALNKDILAQGELMSTKLFCCYLEQQGQDHLLLPALDFMVLDQNEEPNLPLIRSKLTALLAAHTDKKIFITQANQRTWNERF